MSKYTITQFRKEYPNDDACLDKIFQLRYSNITCPKCENNKPFTRVNKRRAYQCPCCGFQLYPTKGTIFEKTTTPLTYWFQAIYLQTTTRNGVAAKELERQLNICYKTALRMAHKIKMLMAQSKNSNLMTGVLEGDETFIGGLNKFKHADKRIPDSEGRSVKCKTPVFGIVKRGGEVRAFVVDDTKSTTLQPLIDANVNKDYSIMITDEWLGYVKLKNKHKHVVVNHSKGEYERGGFHTNTIEGVWSQLKRTIKGTHIHVSKEHLQKYVDEVTFRYMHRNNQAKMFETILKNVV